MYVHPEPSTTLDIILNPGSANCYRPRNVQVCVKSLAEFQKIFDDGCARRLMGQTVDVSSRSHAVLAVTMSSSTAFSGKLNLVDLAGTLNSFN